MLGPPEKYVFAPSESYYFDVLMLLFFMRMSLFRFSAELSDTLMDEENWVTRREKLTALRKQFTRFTVLYRYPIVSNQQQMLELYELQHDCFDIERFFKEVQVEIDNTHEFLEVLESNRLSEAANNFAGDANNIAIYGIPLAVAAVLSALFAVPDLHLIDGCMAKGEYVLDWDRIWEWAVVILASVGTWFFLKRKAEQKKKKERGK